MRHYLYAALLVALLQLLSLVAGAEGWAFPGHWHRTALKVSIGFPLGCLSCTAVRTTGNVPANYPEESEWLPGFHVHTLPLYVDTLLAAATLFGLCWLLGTGSI